MDKEITIFEKLVIDILVKEEPYLPIAEKINKLALDLAKQEYRYQQ